MYLCYSCICVTGTYQTDKFWTLEDEWGILGIEKSVAVTDGDGSQMLRGRMGTETMSDGDGYNFCGNGWGWLDFPLPCRSSGKLARTSSITVPSMVGIFGGMPAVDEKV